MDKMRILAVDDNVVNLATIEQELQDKYEVIPVSSGRRALKVVRQEKVDLILLDIHGRDRNAEADQRTGKRNYRAGHYADGKA